MRNNNLKYDKLKILSFETSCDNTAVSLMEFTWTDSVMPPKYKIIESVNIQHDDVLVQFGGVHPTAVSDAHIKCLKQSTPSRCIQKADLIAYTNGPGLVFSLAPGISFAQTIAAAFDIPHVGINHLDAHLASTKMIHPQVKYPFFSFLISGGHCMFCIVYGPQDNGMEYKVLCQTVDDSPGEVLDKLAREMKICPPSGRSIDQFARQHDEPNSGFTKNVPTMADPSKISFSGVKSMFVRDIALRATLAEGVKFDMCKGIETTIGLMLSSKLTQVLQQEHIKNLGIKYLGLVGGVAANKNICSMIKQTASTFGVDCVLVPGWLAIDNSEMIGWHAAELMQHGCLAQRFRAPGF